MPASFRSLSWATLGYRQRVRRSRFTALEQPTRGSLTGLRENRVEKTSGGLGRTSITSQRWGSGNPGTGQSYKFREALDLVLWKL